MNRLKWRGKRSGLSFTIAILLLFFVLLQGQISQPYAAEAQTTKKEVAAYPATPEGVVKAFVEADLNGAGLSSQTVEKTDRYTTWSDIPMWDTVIVVESFKIIKVKQQLRNAEVKVKYKTIGELSPWTLHKRAGNKIIIFKLVRQDNKWKITKPQTYPHISVETAINDLQRHIDYWEKSREFNKEEMESVKKIIESLRRYLKSNRIIEQRGIKK